MEHGRVSAILDIEIRAVCVSAAASRSLSRVRRPARRGGIEGHLGGHEEKRSGVITASRWAAGTGDAPVKLAKCCTRMPYNTCAETRGKGIASGFDPKQVI